MQICDVEGRTDKIFTMLSFALSFFKDKEVVIFDTPPGIYFQSYSSSCLLKIIDITQKTVYYSWHVSDLHWVIQKLPKVPNTKSQRCISNTTGEELFQK